MNVAVEKPPPCGLYRTTRALPDADSVQPGLLVNLHTCSRAVHGPSLHMPKFNAFNRWEWCRDGVTVSQLSWLATLVALPPEGFYLLKRELRFGDAKWPARSLVQLGYARTGTALVFLAQRRHQLAENSLYFADHGVPLDVDPEALLEALVVLEEPDPNALGGEARVAS